MKSCDGCHGLGLDPKHLVSQVPRIWEWSYPSTPPSLDPRRKIIATILFKFSLRHYNVNCKLKWQRLVRMILESKWSLWDIESNLWPNLESPPIPAWPHQIREAFYSSWLKKHLLCFSNYKFKYIYCRMFRWGHRGKLSWPESSVESRYLRVSTKATLPAHGHC